MPAAEQGLATRLSFKEKPDRTSLSVRERVYIAISEEISRRGELPLPRQIRDEMNFCNDLNADSLDYLGIAASLEEEFDKYIPDEELGKMRFVGQMVNYFIHAAKSSEPLYEERE